MNLEYYNYYLPLELIAQEAVHPRDHCKLMVLYNEKIEHKKFHEIVDYLQKDDILVVNETKVQHCKILGKKETGARVEVTIVRNLGNNNYETRIKGGKLREGVLLIFKCNKARIMKRQDDCFFLEFEKPLQTKELEILTPPYIKKKVRERDYQTVFAKNLGSLAAPTAGLHFTKKLMSKIQKKGVKIAKVQLNISFETFLPVRDVNNHKTGKEYFIIDKRNAGIINSNPKNIVAVGTTVVKCLESCNWNNDKIIPTTGDSHIFIKPGYEFKMPCKAMITNFHLPKSSLLLLTAAFAGRQGLLKAYEEAVKLKYRFFSLGDAMIIFRK
ncbi:tRNA preQ1(34) S-adenosylmethionine ribosyltransferase-isomerase QueA [Candidatus Woesearchaeota archaeon]|nr:tRNA preQ1(34) S-adenosylmethionine ribosyltransferase-isomerase QueA [Candidatus Woesearchaeota archaeon]